jgi:hypothetical protein
MRDLSGLLPSAPLTGNSSMAATNTVTDEAGSFTGPGSPSESTAREPSGTPVPEIPAARPPTVVVHGGQAPRGGNPFGAPAGGGWYAAGDDAGDVTDGWRVP